MKTELPKGKLTVRFSLMRCVYQCYIGRNYISGCSGETCEEALDNLRCFFDITTKTKVTIHGHSKPSVTYIS